MRRTAPSIAAAIRQTQPFRSPAHEAAVSLLRTASELRTRFSEVVATADLTLQQYNVLRILRGAGETGLPTLEIRARMVEHEPGITRLIDRLERRGLASRERSKRDRRSVVCRITAAGLRVLAPLDEPMDAADRGALRSLPSRRVAELTAALAEIRHELRRSSSDENLERTSS